MSFGINEHAVFKPVTIAVLIISDTRTLETDTSGQTLAARITAAGHSLHERKIVTDDFRHVPPCQLSNYRHVNATIARLCRAG